MKIQSMQSIPCTQTFQSARSKRTNVDRAASVKDLYESEDRIIENQNKLFAQQNDALAKALFVIMTQNGGSKEVANFQMREADKSLSELSPNMKNFK